MIVLDESDDACVSRVIFACPPTPLHHHTPQALIAYENRFTKLPEHVAALDALVVRLQKL